MKVKRSNFCYLTHVCQKCLDLIHDARADLRLHVSGYFITQAVKSTALKKTVRDAQSNTTRLPRDCGAQSISKAQEKSDVSHRIVCVRERERVCVRVRVLERESVCVRECECLCVCVCERERECVCVRERECV